MRILFINNDGGGLADQVLNENDRVSITATKIEGA